MKWLVLGSGISAIAGIKTLLAKQSSIYVYDEHKILQPTKDFLLENHVNIIETATRSPFAVKNFDAILISPAIAPSHPIIKEAFQQSVPVLTDIDLALADFKGRIIGVTGTNGKSTVTSMCTHILNCHSVNAFACGNIGKSPCDLLSVSDPKTVWVIELSSFQLKYMRKLRADVAIFTSFSPDHLNWHTDIEDYFLAKWRLFSEAKPGFIVLAQSLKSVLEKKHLRPFCDYQFVNETHVKQDRKYPFSCKHDYLNAALSSAAAGSFLKKDPNQLLDSLKTFKPLPHRFELIGQRMNQPVINDSKATNVASVLNALENVHSPCCLLLGGLCKDESFSDIMNYKAKIAKILCFGEAASKIKAQLACAFDIKTYKSLQECIAQLKDEPARTILFSPGCASFDEFRNFGERGDFFKAKLRELLD